MRFELLPPVPAVTVAGHLKRIPLFGFAQVEELFRIATIARQVRHPKGALLQEAGAAAEYIHVLVEGKIEVEGLERSGHEVTPPAMLAFREVLEGARLRETARALEDSICLVLSAAEFRDLLSDNIELATGLFRTLLSQQESKGPPSVLKRVVRLDGDQSTQITGGMGHIQRGLYLQELPIFARATPSELLEVARLVREVRLQDGSVLFNEGVDPAIYVVLSGEIALNAPEGGDRVEVKPGDALGITETLSGNLLSWRGVVTKDGLALRIDRDELFELLSGRVDLLQGLFGSLFNNQDRAQTGAS